jgi:signal transduction histidine kinase
MPLVRDGRVVGAICAFRAVLGETGNGLVRLEFSNMASHLLRSPLSFIQAGVDLLLNGDLNGEEQGVVLHKMREQSQRMRDFIKDLLELARLESGSVDIYPEPVVLPPIIKRVLSLVQTEEADYEFSFRSPGEFPIVAADPGKLELILLALLHSAMNRCPSGGHIDIELEMHETEALISIQDNGEVIPAKQLERIFSQYYPVDDDNDKMPSTYQIGLYATKRLIELQNGRVWVESQPGKGTRLGFSLPFWE